MRSRARLDNICCSILASLLIRCRRWKRRLAAFSDAPGLLATKGSDLMLTRVTLIRHGETAWNVNGRWQGQAAVPLNDEGRRQAMLLAEHLRPRAAEFAAIYSSDSLRAQETAELIASRLDRT